MLFNSISIGLCSLKGLVQSYPTKIDNPIGPLK